MQNGSRISSSMILFREALFLLRIYVNFVIGSLPLDAHQLVVGKKRVQNRLTFPTLNWIMLFGKAIFNIITKMLVNPSHKITNEQISEPKV